MINRDRYLVGNQIVHAASKDTTFTLEEYMAKQKEFDSTERALKQELAAVRSKLEDKVIEVGELNKVILVLKKQIEILDKATEPKIGPAVGNECGPVVSKQNVKISGAK